MSRDIDTLRHVDSERHRAVTSRGGRRRFIVRSLGWTVLDDVTSLDSDDHGHVQRCVNKSITRLSLGRRDMTDAVGRWGDVRVACHGSQV